MINLSMDETPDITKKFVEKMGLGWTHGRLNGSSPVAAHHAALRGALHPGNATAQNKNGRVFRPGRFKL